MAITYFIFKIPIIKIVTVVYDCFVNGNYELMTKKCMDEN